MASERPPGDPSEVPTAGGVSLDVETVLSEGLDGLLSVTGGQLVVVLAGLGFVSTILQQSLFVRFLEGFYSMVRETLDTSDPEVQTALTEFEATIDTMGLAVDLSLPVVLGGLLVLAILGEALMIVAARAFADLQLDGVSRELAVRRLPIATLYGFLGGLVILLAISVGLILLVVPGVVVYVATVLFRQEVAIADKGPLAAISGSWELTKGNRWTLFAIALILWVVSYLVAFAAGYVPGTAGVVVHTVANSALAVFAVAVFTNAYVRLRQARQSPV